MKATIRFQHQHHASTKAAGKAALGRPDLAATLKANGDARGWTIRPASTGAIAQPAPEPYRATGRSFDAAAWIASPLPAPLVIWRPDGPPSSTPAALAPKSPENPPKSAVKPGGPRRQNAC